MAKIISIDGKAGRKARAKREPRVAVSQQQQIKELVQWARECRAQIRERWNDARQIKAATA